MADGQRHSRGHRVGRIRIAHLSDVHLAPLPPFELRHWTPKRALGFANWRRRRHALHTAGALAAITEDLNRRTHDHTLVSGDLVNIALPNEFARAVVWLGALGPPDTVSVVPGNHDIYVRLYRDEGIGRWRDYMASDSAGLDLAGTAGVGVSQARFDERGVLFPYVRCLGQVAVIGLNSACVTPLGFASGQLGDGQIDRLARLLDATKAAGYFRLVMIHHPPLPGQAGRRRGLEDAETLERTLERHGAELVVHGHNHRDMEAWVDGPGGSFPVLGIGSASTAYEFRGEPMASYRIYEIESDPAGWRLTVESYGLSPNAPAGHVIELGRRKHRIPGAEPAATTSTVCIGPA